MCDCCPTAEQQVAVGVEFLDKHAPGWEHEIDIDILDISSGDSCICGQLYGMREPGYNGFDYAIQFVLPPNYEGMGFTNHSNASFDQLTHEWVRIIEARV